MMLGMLLGVGFIITFFIGFGSGRAQESNTNKDIRDMYIHWIDCHITDIQRQNELFIKDDAFNKQIIIDYFMEEIEMIKKALSEMR